MTNSSENKDSNTAYVEDESSVDTSDANSLFQRPKPKNPDTKATSEEGNDTGEDDKDNDYVPAKRYFDLKSHHDKVVSELRKEVQELKDNSQTSTNDDPSQDNEILQKFKESHPEEYEKLTTLVKGEVEPKVKELEEQLSTLNEREAKIKKAEAQEKVKEAHPDLDEIVTNDDFHTWAESQTKEIQEWIYNNPYNSDLAIAAIDLWKAQQAKRQPDTQDNQESSSSKENEEEAASLVRSRSMGRENNQQRKWTKEELKKLSVDEWEKHRDEIYAQLIGGQQS